MPTESGLLTKAEKNPYEITWPNGNPKGGPALEYAKTSKGAIDAVHKKLAGFADFARKYASTELPRVEQAQKAVAAAVPKLLPNESVEFRWELDSHTGAAMAVKISRGF